MAPYFVYRIRGSCSRQFGGMSMLIQEAHPKRIRKHLSWPILLSAFPGLPALAIVFIVLSHH
jgi:hypothetical protein